MARTDHDLEATPSAPAFARRPRVSSARGEIVDVASGVRRREPRPRGTDVRATLMVGLGLWLAFFGGLGAWASLAPLQGAVVAAGTVKVQGDRKEVEHLEGGILREGLVRDGDVVEAGQVLFRLDETRLAASRRMLRARLVAAEARNARITAEKTGKASLVLPDGLESPPDAELAHVAETQRALFVARKARHEGALRLRDERIGQVRQEIAAYEAQMQAASNQLILLADEIKDATWLYKRGLKRKPQYLALQRQREQIDGEIRQKRALIARAHQEIAKTEEEKLQLRREREDDLAKETTEVAALLVDARERIAIVEEQMSRLEVRAPMGGTVVGLATRTAGAVISPGKRLLEIVPHDATLVVEARIAPDDIDNVTPGDMARVRLSAFNARRVPPVNARLTVVSADRMEDERTGLPYYKALLELDRASLAAAGPLSILPGMSAEVYVETRAMTMLDYLLDPLIKSLDRATRDR